MGVGMGKKQLILLVIILLISLLVSACAPRSGLDGELAPIIQPYKFSIIGYEVTSFFNGIDSVFSPQVNDAEDVSQVTSYFSNVQKIHELESEIGEVKPGNDKGNLPSLEADLKKLRQQNTVSSETVENILEKQVSEILTRQGIFSPHDNLGLKFGFPPVNFKLGNPTHLLVISPRDRIESMKEMTFIPGMTTEDMEGIESAVDNLGFSSLVVEVGGFAAYPSYVSNTSSLRFTLNTIAEEWVHQYLAFKPLGFRYVLDILGIHKNYDIATMNETVAGIVSREIGSLVYDAYYKGGGSIVASPSSPASFDFNSAMRQIRLTVDGLLAKGQVDQAETLMEQQRQYLETKGYYIRKLNQAYFAFYGTYADSPTSVSPIGTGIKMLRQQSATLKDFLNTAASLTGPQDLDRVLTPN
jgi:hypothetical protein